MKEKKYWGFLLVLLSFFVPLSVWGVMSSTNYTIYADDFAVGGVLSSGTNYSLQDTVGDLAVGTSTSANYEIRGGYQAMENGSISIAVSKSALDLGVLSISAVKSDSATVTVSTDSASGYSLSLGSVSAAPLAAVSGGAVVAGTEGYGVALAGVSRAFIDDRSIIQDRILASNNQPINNDQIVLTVKAAIGAGTSALALNTSQSIILNASANF